MTIDFNPALNNISGPARVSRPELVPLSEAHEMGLVTAPSPEQIRQLQAYYGDVLGSCDCIRGLGSQCYRFEDAGAGQAIENLQHQNPQGPLTAEQLVRLIQSATEDLDNSAAGAEFNDLQKFVQSNWNRMDDKAKQVWQVYYEKVMESRSQGKSGIDNQQYEEMLKDMKEIAGCQDDKQFKDASAGEAIKALEQENPEGVISGDQMRRLIYDATSDADSQAAGKEFDDLSKFVKKNYGRLSAEAKEMWDIYARTVEELRGQGQTGIPSDRYEQMFEEMEEIQESNEEASENYEDPGAGDAIESLQRRNPEGQISGVQMRRLVLDATKDKDGQAAGAEYEDLKRFVDANRDRLSDEALAIWQVYSRTVERSRSQGQDFIDDESYQEMVGEMKDVLEGD
jgi:gas vesicle protein